MTVPNPKQNSLDIEGWPENASWKRRRIETDKSWMAFFTYLCLPAEERSVVAAWRDFAGEKSTAIPSNWYRWFHVHHWEERVLDFERWRRARDQFRVEQERAEETRRWDAVRLQERERGLKVGQALIEKAQAMLQFPLAEVERTVSVYDDGRTREVQVFKPAGWNFGTVARMIEVGSKLVQLMSQMATDRHQLDLRLIYDEADRVAQKVGMGVTRDDVLAMADQIAREHQERLEEEGRG